jgi:hypothetical protein
MSNRRIAISIYSNEPLGRVESADIQRGGHRCVGLYAQLAGGNMKHTRTPSSLTGTMQAFAQERKQRQQRSRCSTLSHGTKQASLAHDSYHTPQNGCRTLSWLYARGMHSDGSSRMEDSDTQPQLEGETGEASNQVSARGCAKKLSDHQVGCADPGQYRSLLGNAIIHGLCSGLASRSATREPTRQSH